MRAVLVYVPGVVGGFLHGTRCSPVFFLSVDAQAGLEPVVERNGCTFLSAAWHGEAFHGLGFQDVRSLILVDALFLLDGGRRMKERKKKKSPWGRRVS
jgi:hypothetical protein